MQIMHNAMTSCDANETSAAGPLRHLVVFGQAHAAAPVPREQGVRGAPHRIQRHRQQRRQERPRVGRAQAAVPVAVARRRRAVHDHVARVLQAWGVQ